MILVMNTSIKVESKWQRPETLLTTVIICSVFILFWYYRGDLRDAAAYLTWGKSVLQNQNPYQIYASRSGSFGPVVISLLIMAVPHALQTLLVQVLSFISVGMVIQCFFSTQERLTRLSIYLLAIWSSPFRENLATNQVSIIVIGIMCAGVIVFQKYSNKAAYVFLAASLIAVALDLKPHLTLFFLAYLLVRKRALSLALYVFGFLLITHGAIDLLQRKVLEISWFNQLSSLNKLAKAGNLNDSVSFWPLGLKIFHNANLMYLISTMLLITLLFFTLRFAGAKYGDAEGIALSFLVPAVSIYFHFYDLAILAILAIGVTLQIKRNFLQIAAISYILLPLEYQSIRNIIIFGFLTVYFGMYKTNPRSAIPSIVGGVIIGIIFRVSCSALSLNPRDTQVLMVSLSIIILASIVFNAIKRNHTSLTLCHPRRVEKIE